MNKKSIGQIYNTQLLKRVLTFSYSYKKYLFISLFAAVALSFLGPIRPLLINYAIDNYIIVEIPMPKELLEITILIVLLLFLEGFAQFSYIFLSTWIGQHVIQDLRGYVFRHILSLKMRYFDKKPIGTLVTRTVSDIETIAAIFSEGLLIIMAEILKLIMILVIMFYTDWRLALISLITIPFLLIATAWFKKNIKFAFIDVRNQVSNINTFLQERIVGMKIVQIFNKEHVEYSKFKKINKDHRSAHIRSIFYYAVFFPIVEILSAISIGFLIWYGGNSIISGKEITPGQIVAFILFIHMMFRPIRQLADRFNILQMGIVGSDRVFKVLDTNEKIIDNGKESFNRIQNSISFVNVSFCYKPKIEVLKNISFNIYTGQTVALIGKTGSGKTSIINILNRFYNLKEGEIKIDDINIDKFKLHELRRGISLIQQEVFLFADSIYNNIALYDDSISIEDIKNAAMKIGLHKFISDLPHGYDYIVGERGVNISAGQRQLIAFLRVYVRDPKVLILDEATSSIDSTTEELIQKALKEIAKERTTIIIAHRLSTIKHVDNILHIDDGKLIEQGNHEQLMKKNGKYAKMFKKQNK